MSIPSGVSTVNTTTKVNGNNGKPKNGNNLPAEPNLSKGNNNATNGESWLTKLGKAFNFGDSTSEEATTSGGARRRKSRSRKSHKSRKASRKGKKARKASRKGRKGSRKH